MIPANIKPFLWSYDTEKLDIKNNQKRIIINVLNLGNKQATDWLFEVYSSAEIKAAMKSPLGKELSPKSLNYWKLILNLK